MHHLLPGRGLRLVRGPPPRLEAICYGRAREGIRRIPEWLWWKVWRGVTGWLRSQHCESRNVVDMIREGGGARGILRPRLGDVQLTARATDMERPVNSATSVRSRRCSSVAGAGQATVEAAVSTVDHSDIRGSSPEARRHGRDPSGAASD